jgi:hypothetical protein
LDIVSDGWSNIRNEHLINFVVTFPDNSKPLFIKSIHVGEERQFSVNIAKYLETEVLAIGLEKVSGIVTDNAPNMKGAWRILEDKYPGLICNGCAAHTLNLLVKNICKLPRFSPTLTKCKEITTFIRDRTALIERFRKIQSDLKQEGLIEHSRNLEYVVETQWYTHQRCVSRVLGNKMVLEQLINHPVASRLDATSNKKKRFYPEPDNFCKSAKEIN